MAAFDAKLDQNTGQVTVMFRFGPKDMLKLTSAERVILATLQDDPMSVLIGLMAIYRKADVAKNTNR